MRHLALIAAFTFLVGNAFGDAAPEPPPKGKKYVGVESSVAVDKSVTGYVFAVYFAEGRGGRGPNITYSSIKLSEKATVLAPGMKPDNRGRAGKVVAGVAAIPAEVAKKYASEKELTDALNARSVEGIHKLGLRSTDFLSTDDKRAIIPCTYTITAIDAKTGIAFKKERDGKPDETKDEGEESDEPLADATGNSRPMVAGLFLAAAFVGLGLWLVSRRRVA